MSYKENPKTAGSGILCGIPQRGRCPNNCADCFFQSGRSYLEPLEDNLPNMPPLELCVHRVLRVNDGNDSNVQRNTVMTEVDWYPMKFYNTAIPEDLEGFGDPVVLTINPGKMTDDSFHRVRPPIPKNLMFVRFRMSAWNSHVADEAVEYYSEKEVPIVLTFMAYYDEDSVRGYKPDYVFRERTLNSYWAITTSAWERLMGRYKHNVWVHSCGKIEGELGSTACRHCGNCLREYFASMERLRAA